LNGEEGGFFGGEKGFNIPVIIILDINTEGCFIGAPIESNIGEGPMDKVIWVGGLKVVMNFNKAGI
jgi:hypothetical protein